MPLYIAKRYTSSSDFIQWMVWREEKKKIEREQHEKIEWYMARVALEVYRANTQVDVAKRNSAVLKDFLLKFEEVKPITDEEDKAKKLRESVMNTKMFFAMLTGVGAEGIINAKDESSKQDVRPKRRGRTSKKV